MKTTRKPQAKITITDIRWVKDGQNVELPKEVVITDDDPFLSELVDEATNKDDITSTYIHRSEDTNGEPSFFDRLEALVDEAEDNGLISDWLSDKYGYLVDGFMYQVTIE